MQAFHDNIADALVKVCASMRASQVQQAEAEFYGSGDSGDHFETTLDAETDATVEIDGRTTTLEDGFGHLAEAVVDTFHAGYEQDNGGGGYIKCHADGLLSMDAYHTVQNEYCDSAREDADDATTVPTGKSEYRSINVKRILDAMEAIGIETITVEYSGGGDSGGVDEVTIQGHVPEDFDLEVWQMSSSYDQSRRDWVEAWHLKRLVLIDAVRDVSESLKSAYFGGFENNEGGRGEITFSFEEKAALMDHTNYGEGSDYTFFKLIDPSLSELETLHLFEKHDLEVEQFRPLTPRQAALKSRMESEDLQALFEEYGAAEQTSAVAEDTLEAPRG